MNVCCLFYCNNLSMFGCRSHVGLGTEYFRILLQSNCGVSVLDFTPNPEGGSPQICLNRLNQVFSIVMNEHRLSCFLL